MPRTYLTCEHCDRPARYLIFDSVPSMFVLACDDYENDVARLEGEMELEEIGLDAATTQEIVDFLNERLSAADKRYRELLDKYLALKKSVDATPSSAPN